MTVSAFDSAIFAPLFSDEQAASLFDDAAQVRAMLQVEAALAGAEAALNIIPAEAAARIIAAAGAVAIDPSVLGSGVEQTGVAIPALVDALRAEVGGDAANYVHWGATSQDIIDTAQNLRLAKLCDLYEERLDKLIVALASIADEHRNTVMAARTRSQQASPTTFGLKVAGWLAPLLRHRERMAELRPRLLVVQLGGAAGTLAALGESGLRVAEQLAAELRLGVPPMPWHTQRDTIMELAGWMSLVTGSLGKVGQDTTLLAQSEVNEVRAGPAGGSSTLPQKANPFVAEILVALARFSGGLLSTLSQSMVQEHERDGASWSLEWLILPQMAVAAAAALRHANVMSATVSVDAERMRRNLDDSRGLILAEAASFALVAYMPRAEATALVKAACRTAVAENRQLMDVLAERTDAPVDWEALTDPMSYLGAADALIDRVLADCNERPGGVEKGSLDR
jgi:3-carboxy-cis,cis-muconate cycloisomerase